MKFIRSGDISRDRINISGNSRDNIYVSIRSAYLVIKYIIVNAYYSTLWFFLYLNRRKDLQAFKLLTTNGLPVRFKLDVFPFNLARHFRKIKPLKTPFCQAIRPISEVFSNPMEIEEKVWSIKIMYDAEDISICIL